MKKNFKKTLSLILAVLMVMTAVPLSGMAADAHEHEYRYTYDADGVHMVRCKITGCKLVELEDCSGGTATCLSGKVCEKCETEYTDKLDHDFTEKRETADYIKDAADCQTFQTYYYSCANEGCTAKGETDFTSETKKGDHVWNDGTVTGATCTADGTRVFECAVEGCDETKSETATGSATGHNFTAEVEEDKYLVEGSVATCGKGLEYYKSCANAGCEEKGSEKFTSSVKGEHNFTDADKTRIATAATCSAAATYYKRCSECNKYADELNVEGQTFSYGDPHAKPTTSAGVIKATAVDKTKYPDIKEADYIRKQATCDGNAIYSYLCSRCFEPMIAAGTDMGDPALKIKEGVDFYVKEDTALNPNHSNLKKDMKKSSDAVEATCTKSGTTEIYECTVDGCGAKVGGAEIPAKGHKYDEAKTKNYTPASCSKDGTYGYKYCTECKGEFYFNEKGEEITQTETVLKPLKQFGHTDDDQDSICDTCNAEVTAQETCKCICHSGGIMYFIVLILKFIWRTTGAKPTCPAPCGQAHY